jgi:hypothetical protein
MAVSLAKTRNLPRANVRDPANPFPADQYVRVSNVAIFSEHETKTPNGDPQRFDQDALERLIDRGNERIEVSGDYAAVCVGHTHDPDDPNGAEEQPEVIGAMGPYRLGLLGHPGTRQKYAILADLWIRRDKIDKYNAHPRRSVELWYEHDQPAWIDPLSLLTEAPRLDLGLTPLIPADAGSDGGELKYLYAARFGTLRMVKYAAACASAGNVFVPAETGAPKKYAAEPNKPQTTRENLMLAPEDIRQICDAIEELDVITAMRDFLPLIPRIQEMMTAEDAEKAAAEEVPNAELPGEVPPKIDEAVPSTEPVAEAPLEAPAEKPPEALPEDLAKVKHSADESTNPKPEAKDGEPETKLADMSEDEIEKYLCDKRKARYAADAGTVDGKAGNAPVEGTVDPGKVSPAEGSVAGDTQKAKYSMLEAKLAALEADKIERTNEARKEKLRTMRYHRAFDLAKEVTRTTYAKMSDEQFKEHVEFIAEVATPTMANSPMPVPDELLDSAQPPASVRQGPEKYTKEKCEEAGRICYAKRQEGKNVSYELILDAVINGKPIPE